MHRFTPKAKLFCELKGGELVSVSDSCIFWKKDHHEDGRSNRSTWFEVENVIADSKTGDMEMTNVTMDDMNKHFGVITVSIASSVSPTKSKHLNMHIEVDFNGENEAVITYEVLYNKQQQYVSDVYNIAPALSVYNAIYV